MLAQGTARLAKFKLVTKQLKVAKANTMYETFKIEGEGLCN